MKKIQTVLEEVIEISRISMVLYDADGNCVASAANVDAALENSIQEFLRSDVDSQSLGTYHYFKIICSDTLSYVLLVSNYTSDSFTIGRLTVCQLKHLLESQEDSITKSGFIRNLVNGALTPSEISRQIKRLKLSPTTWAAFVVECPEGLTDSYAYHLLDHAFAGHKMDFCCELDETHLLLIKESSNIVKEYKPSTVSAKTKGSRKKKTDETLDAE